MKSVPVLTAGALAPAPTNQYPRTIMPPPHMVVVDDLEPALPTQCYSASMAPIHLDGEDTLLATSAGARHISVEVPSEERETDPNPLFSEVVCKLLLRAHSLALSEDQPYMPLPNTTLKEAVVHLRRQGYILVLGGRIDYSPYLKGFRLTVLGKPGTHIIFGQEVRRLLCANYPRPARRPRLVVSLPTNLEPNTDPCPAPIPSIRPGFPLLVADYEYGSDIDLIPEEGWDESLNALCPEHLHTVYVGERDLGGVWHHVWWSMACGCYLAQLAPTF